MPNDYMYWKRECSKCGRKIVVEQFLIGVNHAHTTVANCLECVTPHLPDGYVKEHPEAAADLLEWRGNNA